MRFRQNMGKIVTASLVAVLAVSVVIAGQSYAQQAAEASTANTLKVSPLRTDVTANPGETKVVKIIVTNPSDNEISVKPIENDFVADDAEDGSPAIILDENEYAEENSLKRFLVPMESFNIPAKESVTVEATIVVPNDAEPGGYFGAVRFAPTTPDGGGQVNTSPSVASLILLRVNGDVTEKLELTDFQLLQSQKATNFLTSTDDLSMLVRFKNDSKVQLAPFGEISVQKGNEVVYKSSFNSKEQQDMILPSSARRWNVPLTDIEGFGKYKVTATFSYGTSNQTEEVSQYFWVIPLPILLLAIIILAVVVLVVVLLVLKRRSGGKHSKNMSLK